MHSITYDVAVSVDGFIAGPSGDVSKFACEGEVVDDYNDRLSSYRVAIMGAATYAFGYRFGLEPGQNPYPNMTTYVFSRSLELPTTGEVIQVRRAGIDKLRTICGAADGPIYLVGGGRFSAALLKEGLIDRLRLKRAPIFLGGGTPLFEQGFDSFKAILTQEKTYNDGCVFQQFDLKPGH